MSNKKKEEIEIDSEKLLKAIPYLCIDGSRKDNNTKYMRMHRKADKIKKIPWHQRDIKLKDLKEAFKRLLGSIDES